MATVTLRVRHYFRLAFKFLYMVYKKNYYFRNQKRFNNGLNGIFWEIRQPYLRVFKKSVIFSSMNRQRILWNLQKFLFPLLTY